MEATPASWRSRPANSVDHIRGIACLSTPFLFFSRNLLATRLTTSWVVTVSLLSFLTPPIVLGGIFGFVVSVVGGSLVTGLLVTLVKRNRQRCEQRLEKLDGYELPSDVVVPLFIARTPGDEASGAIGASRLLNRLVSSAESPTARLVMKVAEDGRAVFIPVFLVTLLAIVLGALGLGVWVAIVLTVMLAPILLGLPVRIAIYGATFGLDLAGFALRYTLTTGPTPLGPTAKGDYRTLLVPLNEMPIAAHSQTYQNEVVWHEIARWAIERSAQQMAGKEG